MRTIRSWSAFPKIACCTGSLLLSAGAALAQIPDQYLTREPANRLALVIGNVEYINADRLPGSDDDAHLVATTLSSLGFDVTEAINVSSRSEFIHEYLLPFVNSVEEGSFVIFYFSGHGFTYGGDSYLLPLDFPQKVKPNEVFRTFIAENSVRDLLMERDPGVLLVFLDSCRNIAAFIDDQSPETKSGLAKGLPALPPPPQNVVIGYSTAPGSISTGSSVDKVSIYTEVLADFLPKDGMEFTDIRREVHFEVSDRTANGQIPWFSESSSAFVFFRRSEKVAEEERTTWLATLETGQSKAVRRFLKLYSVSDYAKVARRWIADQSDAASDFFTHVSPFAAEIAWEQPSAVPVVANRVFGPVALDRTAVAVDGVENVPPSLAGVVLSTGAAPQSEVSGRILAGHGEGIALTSIEARSAPDRSSPVVQTFEYGDHLVIESVTMPDDDSTWLQIAPEEGASAYIAIPESNQPQQVEIGEPRLGLMVPPKTGAALPTLVDGDRLIEAIKELREGGESISWVSIATPRADSPQMQDILALRAAHVSAILTDYGIRRGIITSVEEQDFTGENIRVRVFVN
ncbi:MAG: hypothetical protein QOD94_2064 [Alphaproteobacteria bacterium]|nr:hypothetical protein [Alphaproteobacteria bacterium]